MAEVDRVLGNQEKMSAQAWQDARASFDTFGLSGEEKVRRAALAQRIYTSKEPLALKVEDVALIKKLVGKAYAPLVVMRAWSILDPDSVKES